MIVKSKKKNLLVISILVSITILIYLLIFSFNLIKFNKENNSLISEPNISLYLSKDDKTINLLLEDYIWGVVAAEMPASFEIEALKAQAVCARTYAIKKIIEEKKYPQNADLSDDIYSCQAFISKEEFKKRNPQNHKDLIKKLDLAVHESRGYIMLYQENAIDALYHSSCGGNTENAGDAWFNNLEYLQSVKCTYCKEAPRYRSISSFNLVDFCQALGIENTKKLSIEILSKSKTGRVRELTINGHHFYGEKIRTLLGLRSRTFKFKKKGEEIIINTKGYGHGVGMCQYGANGLAKEENDFREILDYYYQDIDFYKIPYKK